MNKKRPVLDLSRNKPVDLKAKPKPAKLARPSASTSAKRVPKQPLNKGLLLVYGASLVGVLLWAYWPTLAEAERAWSREPDYSHGYLVLPMALFMLWMSRSRFPGVAAPSVWIAAALICLSVAMRWASAALHTSAIDGWSLLPWTAGTVAALFGWRVMIWSAPAIGFLWFLVPLPFRFEDMLSLPLQRVATMGTCFALQCLGQPAVAEGNVIFLGDNVLEVAQACSGLRLLVGVFALSYLFIAVTKGPWWEKLLLLLSVIPIALVANSTRIVITGLLYQYVSSDAGRHFSHDLAGWVMIPWAALLFGFVLWYLRKLTPEVELPDMANVVKEFAT